MPPSRISIRTLASQLGLSKTVVSDALNGRPGVNQETRQKVKLAAEAAGYKRNPLASAVMSRMRQRADKSKTHETLAIIGVHEPNGPRGAGGFNQAIITGARDRAREIGFRVQTFSLGFEGLTARRLSQILRWRGIKGVVFLPIWKAPDFSDFEWVNYAAAYLDFPGSGFKLHAVSCDHYTSMIEALERVAELGFRRPGFYILSHPNRRIQYRWTGAFTGYQLDHPEFGRVPPLLMDDYHKESFQKWFRLHRPDVVLGHHPEVVDWMKECGAEIPAKHGFVCLNSLSHGRPCAGLDLQPHLIGARGVDIVVSQLHLNESGLPDVPVLITIPARWIDGPTLLAARAE